MTESRLSQIDVLRDAMQYIGQTGRQLRQAEFPTLLQYSKPLIVDLKWA
jgi:hypothetical protein